MDDKLLYNLHLSTQYSVHQTFVKLEMLYGIEIETIRR
jgi:hypothetical protein